MKRYKYQALVRLLPETGAATTALPSGTSRMVIKAEHRETHASKLFSSLVTRDDIVGTRNSGRAAGHVAAARGRCRARLLSAP